MDVSHRSRHTLGVEATVVKITSNVDDACDCVAAHGITTAVEIFENDSSRIGSGKVLYESARRVANADDAGRCTDGRSPHVRQDQFARSRPDERDMTGETSLVDLGL